MAVSGRIELESSQVVAGATVDGSVKLQCSDTVSCRGVLLEVGYQVSGKGNPYTGLVHNGMLHQGHLQGQVEVDLPFSVPIPADGPISYHGKHISIDWFVKARVDIPIFADQRFSEGFVVTPREEPGEPIE